MSDFNYDNFDTKGLIALHKESEKEVLRLREELSKMFKSDKHLYEVNDEITIWDTPEGKKTSIKTTIVKGFRLL